jgi:hypothetical protein
MPVSRIKQKIRHVDNTTNPVGREKNILQQEMVMVIKTALLKPFYPIPSPTARWLTPAGAGELIYKCKSTRGYE